MCDLLAIPCCGIPSVILAAVSFWCSRFGHAHLRHNQRYLGRNGLLNALCGDGRAVDGCQSSFVVFACRLGSAYGTKMAEAVAPVSLTASATLAKTGLPRCSEPAFLGFVPPTTFVPASRVNGFLSCCGAGWWDGRIPYSMACCAWKLCQSQHTGNHANFYSSSTHVPCFPVKPWNNTLVSPLMRRFLMVSAYCEEPVAYCLVAAFASAERMGCRRACIVALGDSHEGRAGSVGGGYRQVRRWWSWI
jgi:hypothetical protein